MDPVGLRSLHVQIQPIYFMGETQPLINIRYKGFFFLVFQPSGLGPRECPHTYEKVVYSSGKEARTSGKKTLTSVKGARTSGKRWRTRSLKPEQPGKSQRSYHSGKEPFFADWHTSTSPNILNWKPFLYTTCRMSYSTMNAFFSFSCIWILLYLSIVLSIIISIRDWKFIFWQVSV